MFITLQAGDAKEDDASAILVFLPGAPEISRLIRVLQQSASLQRAAAGQKLLLLPLHGSLPPTEQVTPFDNMNDPSRLSSHGCGIHGLKPADEL